MVVLDGNMELAPLRRTLNTSKFLLHKSFGNHDHRVPSALDSNTYVAVVDVGDPAVVIESG
jgi:hypothetical protein